MAARRKHQTTCYFLRLQSSFQQVYVHRLAVRLKPYPTGNWSLNTVTPKVRIGNSRISRGHGTKRTGYMTGPPGGRRRKGSAGLWLADLTLAQGGPTLATLVRPPSEDLFARTAKYSQIPGYTWLIIFRYTRVLPGFEPWFSRHEARRPALAGL